MGAGGSILTVPVLVYLLHINVITATSYSLFIVGITSLVGGIKAYLAKQVNLHVALLFGIPSVVTAFTVREWLLPGLPDQFFKIGRLVLTKELFLLLFFAVMMIIAAIKMIRPARYFIQQHAHNYLKIIIYGLFTGLITGLIGAGGGFLIIPALVLLLGLPMKNAIGTSLVIITINTLVTFSASLSNTKIDWDLLLLFSAFSITGIFIGMAIGKKVPGEKLRPAFGWFVLLMGIYIFIKEIVG